MTDASGVPTSPDNIPTYNTSADAPSGLGFNTAMAQLQAIITNIKAGTLASGKIQPAGINWTGAYPFVNADLAAAAAIAVSKLAPGSNTQFLQTTGGVAVWGAGPSASTLRKVTSKDVSNTVTETDLLNGEITIPANPGTSAVIRLTAWGDHELNGNSTAPQWKLKLGATTLIDTGNFAWQTLGTNRTGWKLVAEIMNLGAANVQRANFLLTGSADYNGNGTIVNSRPTGFVTGDGAYAMQGNVSTSSRGATYIAQGGNAGAVDTTASQVLAFTITNPLAAVTYDVKLIGALVEII